MGGNHENIFQSTCKFTVSKIYYERADCTDCANSKLNIPKIPSHTCFWLFFGDPSQLKESSGQITVLRVGLTIENS